MKALLAITTALLLMSAFTMEVHAEWTVQNSGIPTDDQVVLAAANANVCWGVTRATGARWVTRTTNGGTNWIASSHDSLSDFFGIAALNADTAWIAAAGGVYKTTNGGVSWTQQLAVGMLVIRFFDNHNGICIGGAFAGPIQVYTTTDGGSVWAGVPSSNIPPAAGGAIPSNCAAVGSTLWCPTNGGSLYKTTDRGITWSVTQNVGGTSGGVFVAFKDAENGLATASNTVFRTSDGGANWTSTGSVPSGVSAFLPSYIPGTNGSYMITSNTYPILTRLNGSAYTLDNGATWTTVDNLAHGWSAFVSFSVGWSGGGANVIYKWTGSLGQWTVQSSGTTNSLLHVRAVSPSVAWAEGIGATVLRTTNGGDIWTPASGGAFGADYISGIEAVNRDTAFVPFNPGGGTTTHIYRTTNGGANWNSVYAQSPGSINVIRMVDAANGIALGDPSGGKWTVLKTSDGGSTWGRILTEPNEIGGEIGSWFDGMCVVGTSHIWFTSQSGRVYRSTNGGTTWNYSAIPFTGFLPRIHFNDIQHGLVGNPSSTAVLRTTDGGASWSEITLPNSDNVGGITGSGNDFYVNKGQQIFHSGDRGETYSVSYPGGIGGVLRGNCSVVDGTNMRVWAVTEAGGILRYDTPLTVTGVKEIHREMPGAFKLEQNYPNPFNPMTRIGFRVQGSGLVSLRVFDLLGKEVRTLVNENLQPGSYSVQFNASGLASGVYFYRLEAGAFVETKRLLLLK